MPRNLGQEGNWAWPNFMHHVITNVLAYLLKAKSKQWPNLNLNNDLPCI